MRTFLAIFLAKTIYFFTRTLRVGGGSAAPGYYALKIAPNLVSDLVKQIPQNIVITGTNGKTTTARLLSHLLNKNHIKIIRNSTGSNLERGIASSLLEKTNLWGNITNIEVGIWEIDEAAFNSLVPKIKPQIIAFLNAYRDQLDRYGEVDSVIKKWDMTLDQIDWETQIIINNSDYRLNQLQKHNVNKIITYHIKDHFTDYKEAQSQHNYKNIKSDFEARIIKKSGFSGASLTIKYPKGILNLDFQLPGTYQIYNLLAALTIYYELNLPIDNVQNSLSDFETAFGRLEKVEIAGHDAYIALIKNPVGASSIIETLSSEVKENDKFLIVLNDNFADGLDVSWIWDADFETLAKTKAKQFMTAGTRAPDMAVRLKYAGIDENSITIKNDLEQALDEVKKGLKGRIFILPTYTALLSLQSILTKQGIKNHYWK